jgi:hypothetical protein
MTTTVTCPWCNSPSPVTEREADHWCAYCGHDLDCPRDRCRCDHCRQRIEAAGQGRRPPMTNIRRVGPASPLSGAIVIAGPAGPTGHVLVELWGQPPMPVEGRTMALLRPDELMGLGNAEDWFWQDLGLS